MNATLLTLLVNTVTFLLAVFGCLIIGALMLNNLPLGDPPGLFARLRTYLTTNSAETKRNHPFPELELPRAALNPGLLLTRLELTVDTLGWEIVEVDAQNFELHAVVETPLFKFKDDILVKLNATTSGTEIYIRSSSRVGRGDLGTNTRHILDLLAMLRQQVL
jgi:hypothetical protein